MSNNQQYNTKCFNHPYQDIISICSTCPNNIPVCIDCIVDIHDGHSFKKLNDINLRNQIEHNFRNQTIPKLNNYLENNKKILDGSNNHFKQIQDNHTMNFEKTFKIFKELKDIINAKENDIKRLLLTKLDENTDVNNIITTTIENNNNKINYAINYNNDINNNNDNENLNNNIGFIELLKHNHQCNNLLSNINNNNNLPEYKDTQLIIKENNLESIKDLTNNYLEVFDDIFLNDSKTIKLLNLEYTIYKEGCDISHLNIRYLAIGPIKCLPKNIPPTVTNLLLLDGFNQPLSFIPPTIQYLLLHNIKVLITPGSIPESVKSLFLLDGFDQPLNFIPPTVKYLLLQNIKYKLIPTTVTHLYLLDGFNQPLDFIPPTVKCLYLQNIKYQLIPGSIPNHLAHLEFYNGFSQRITKGMIPGSISSICMGDVVYPLEPDSISNPHQIIKYGSNYKYPKI
ncbi:hypothetical protein DICPUDRAFT_73920 [Dictyostelium purpureum]|uniref:B box-type domain-containing protein n=1 Tax=Dictyostelium purpureum TaxID=5786 RepID=F0Z688_DICPU|nr:uncharacterized protein DICPUDRAFT_73920 [Dictyostelium purpureum]EGC40556.1 hypothetical protein DICPUDRAFT_73920 [Dictyostelium purpureum]|eukprot:XP_003282892.1 hypothetical protein DICPUDRAFT_73920 [Dictyostelium purpureum]